jgi:transposase
MRQFEFSQDVLSEIERDRFLHPDPAVQRRMEALWLKAHGEKHLRIAELTGLSRPTLQRLLDKYESGGLAEARSFHWKVPVSALGPHQADLEAEFRARPPHTVAEACDRIERLTGVRRGETRVREFLRDSLGLRWRKAAAIAVPPKQTPVEHAARQAAFLKDGA